MCIPQGCQTVSVSLGQYKETFAFLVEIALENAHNHKIWSHFDKILSSMSRDIENANSRSYENSNYSNALKHFRNMKAMLDCRASNDYF